MKKIIIGAIVASIILFMWQFLSWTVLNVHGAEMTQTENQDIILETLTENLDGEGSYFVPMAPPNISKEEETEYYETRVGKPWAIVTYHESMTSDMGMKMFRSWAINFLAALLLCWILMNFAGLNFKKALLGSLSVGLIGYFIMSYLNAIFFETNTWGYLIDSVVEWGLVGVWLGFWLPRK